MSLRELLAPLHIIVWGACMPLLPYTFFRKSTMFDSIFVLFVFECIIMLMIMSSPIPPNNWVGWGT